MSISSGEAYTNGVNEEVYTAHKRSVEETYSKETE